MNSFMVWMFIEHLFSNWGCGDKNDLSVDFTVRGKSIMSKCPKYSANTDDNLEVKIINLFLTDGWDSSARLGEMLTSEQSLPSK